MKLNTKRFWKTISIVVAAIAAMYAILTLWSIIVLHRSYAALERDCRPMTVAEVIPPPIPDADNAAPLYEEAIRQLNQEKVGDDTLLQVLSLAARDAIATNATPTDLAHFRELVTRPVVQNAMELVVKAGERKACRFDLNYLSGMDLTCSNLVTLMSVSKVVRSEVNRLIADGEYSNAWCLAIAGLRLAEAKRTEPFVIPQLATFMHAAIAGSSVGRLCSATPVTREQADCLLAILKRFDDPAEFQRVLDGDRLLLGDKEFARSFRNGPPPVLLMGGELPRWKLYLYLCVWRPLWRLDHAAYLRVLQVAAAAPLSSSLSSVHVPEYCFCTRACLSALESYRAAFIGHLACVRCAEAGLSVLVYQKEHGQWPATLAACMAQVPTDPFDGKPLRYRMTGKGFVVSSVGKSRSQKEIAWKYEPAFDVDAKNTPNIEQRNQKGF
ncbi:MAG: hypothetical protein WCR06_02850 [bacterium]